MLELLRVFLGYCINCRLPKIVGEFKILGWKHTFNLCSGCVQAQANKVVEQESFLAMELYGEGNKKGEKDHGATENSVREGREPAR